MTSKNKIILIGVLVLTVIVATAYVRIRFNEHGSFFTFVSPSKLTIDRSSENYGRFIEGEDNNYFATHDANVRNIIQTYLTNPTGFTNPTDAQKYGFSLIYYYNQDTFIVAEKTEPVGNTITAFTMHSMKTGKQISDCSIFPVSGFYKSSSFMLSASFVGEAPYAKEGVCFYERGAPDFTFINLSSNLSGTETLFSDSSGHNLNATIKNMDTHRKTFTIYVYDTTQKAANGNYAYKRSITVSY